MGRRNKPFEPSHDRVRRALRKDTHSPALVELYDRARQLLDAGDARLALPEFCRLVLALPAEHPAEPAIRVLLARTYLELGRYERALAEAHAAHRRDPAARLPAEVAQRAFVAMQRQS
jgi:predicted Zn-dependent protease